MSGDRGFVLLNALILTAAFAAAASLVLHLAERDRLRQAGAVAALQGSLYLDGAEAHVLTVLRRDQMLSPIDGPGDAWADKISSAELDRATADIEIRDLQGGFNINWLANPEDQHARQAFRRLAASLGVPLSAAQAFEAYLQSGGPVTTGQYLQAGQPVRPAGGPVLMAAQLRGLPGVSVRASERLMPFLAALPGDAGLNLNSASAEVIAALLPGTSPEAVLAARARDPFTTPAAFFSAAGVVFGDGGVPEIEETRYRVGTDWFEASIAVRFEGRILRRTTVIERHPLPKGPQVAYRLEARP